MAFWFRCPVCTSKRLATDGIIGRRVRCADCNNFVEVTPPAPEDIVDDAELMRQAEKGNDESVEGDDWDLDDDFEGLEELDLDLDLETPPAKPPAKTPASKSPPAKTPAAKTPAKSKSPTVPPVDGTPADDKAIEEFPDDLDLSELDDFAEEDDDDDDWAAADELESSGFELAAPSAEIQDFSAFKQHQREDSADAASTSAKPPKKTAKKTLEWKTLETEGDDPEPPKFGGRKKREDTEMDMTPMVDVTFLLLIFFMVTASFVMQKSMNRPTETTDDPSTEQTESEEENLDTVEVEIDEFNSYFVTLPESEPREAHSEQDLRIALREAKEGSVPATKLLIRAHEDSTHGRVITAMDVGADLDYSMQVQILEEL
jgi:biopolymer transport protein ExbD